MVNRSTDQDGLPPELDEDLDEDFEDTSDPADSGLHGLSSDPDLDMPASYTGTRAPIQLASAGSVPFLSVDGPDASDGPAPFAGVQPPFVPGGQPQPFEQPGVPNPGFGGPLDGGFPPGFPGGPGGPGGPRISQPVLENPARVYEGGIAGPAQLAPPSLLNVDTFQARANMNRVGNALGINVRDLPTNPDDLMHHGVNARYVLQYFGARNAAERRAVMDGLQDQILNHDNNSAVPVLRKLMLVDAVSRLQQAPAGSREQEQALLDLACLEQGSTDRNLLEQHFPAAQMTPQERDRRIAEMRTRANEIVNTPSTAAQNALETLTRPGATSGDRQTAMDTLERVSRFHSVNGQSGGWQNLHQMEQGIQMGRDFRQNLRDQMSNPNPTGQDAVQSLRGLLTSNDPIAQHLRERMITTPGGRQLLVDAANSNPQVLERSLNSPDVPRELRTLLQSADVARNIRQQLNTGSPEERLAARENLGRSEDGRRLLAALDGNNHELALSMLSAQPLRTEMLRAVQENKTLASFSRLMEARNNPNVEPIWRELQQSAAGQRLMDALGRGDRAGALEVLRTPAQMTELVNSLSRVDSDQAALRQVARGANTPQEFLERFRDQAAVDRAREGARAFDQQNFTDATAALDRYLNRSTANPQEALTDLERLTRERLDRMGNTSLMPALNLIRASQLSQRLTDARTPGDMADALSAYNDAAGTNLEAARFLRPFGTAEQITRMIAGLRAGNEQTTQLVRNLLDMQNATTGPAAAEALGRIAESARGGNEAARTVLRSVTGQSDNAQALTAAGTLRTELATDSETVFRRFREQVPSAVNELNDLRTRRILQGLEATSGSDAYNTPIDRLRQEATAGNRQAADWLKWAETNQQLAALNHAHQATNPTQAATDAVAALTRQADAGNVYARQALALVLAGAAERERTQDFLALDNGVQGIGGEKPMFVPNLRDLPPQALNAVRVAAMDSLERQITNGHTLSKPEAAALALTLSELRRPDAREGVNPQGGPDGRLLDDRIIRLLNAAVQRPGERSAVMQGLNDVLSTDFEGTHGTDVLADIFVRGAEDPQFAASFATFNRWAMTGHEPSLRILAATAGGASSDTRLRTQSTETLSMAGARPDLRDRVRDVLVHSYNYHGDRHALLETMGRLAHQNGNFNDSVRTALAGGLERGYGTGGDLTSSQRDALRRSATAGWMNVPEQWSARQVELLSQNLTPELVDQIARVANRIPASLHRQMFDALMAKMTVADGAPGAQTELAMRLIRHFPSVATAADVRALVQFGKTTLGGVTDRSVAQDLERQTALTLVAVMARGRADASQAAYEAVARDNNWHGLPRTDFRQSLIDYARGRPTDLDASLEVSRLIYDAGIPRPTAGLFKDIGMPGPDSEQFTRAEQAISMVMQRNPGLNRDQAEERVRQIMARIDLFNSLNQPLRTGIGNNGAPVDSRMVAGAIINGTIFNADNPYNFLTGDLNARIGTLRGEQADRLATTETQARELEQERQGVLRAMGEHTREGVGIFDRIGHVGSRIFTLGQSETSIDAYYAQQSQHVASVRNLEERIRQVRTEGEQPRAAVTFYDLARQSYDWSQHMQAGRVREADMLAVQMWGQHGQQLQQHAPLIWHELTRTGNRPIDRNVWQRLAEAVPPMAQFREIPEFRTGQLAGPSGTPPSGLDQALTVLRGLRPGMIDTAPVRTQALAAVDEHPDFARLVRSSGRFADDMSALFGNREAGIVGMFEAGLEGTRYDNFVTDVRRRAANIREALNSIDQPTVNRVKNELIPQLEAAARAATDTATRQALEKRIQDLRGVVRLFDRESTENPSMRTQLERMIETVSSGRYDESTFANWLKKEGIVFAIAIAAAVATVATMGAASPLLVAATASAVAIAASELTTEILYHADIGLGPGQQSRLGNYISGRPEIDPETGRERPREFLRDVAWPYARQWAMDTIICLATMGAGALASRGLNAMGSRAGNFLARHSSTIARAQASMRQFTSLAHNPATQRWASRTMREFVDESMDEFKEEMAGEALEALLARSLGRNSQVLSFLAASGLAAGKGVNFHRVRGSNFIGLTDVNGASLDSAGVAEVARSYEQHGARVFARADGMSYEVRMPDGGTYIVAPQAYLSNVLPSTDRAPSGDMANSNHAQTLSTTDTVDTRTERERATLGDATWQPTADSLRVRQNLQNFTQALMAGDYARAHQIAREGGLGPNPSQVTDTRVDMAIDAADLTNPAKVQEFLARMQGAGRINQDPENAGRPAADRRYEVVTPRPIVRLAGGVQVDLTNPAQAMGPPPRALTGPEQEQVTGLMRTEAVQRILQEQAMTTMEERLIHLSQLHTGQVISPTYARFLADRGVAPTDTTQGNLYYAALRAGQGPNGRAGVTYEQELVALLYDSGMPMSMIEHHFGRQWGPGRAPVLEYLRAREAGTDVRATTVGDPNLTAPTDTLRRDQPTVALAAELTALDTAIDGSALLPADKAKAKELIRASLDASNGDIDAMRQGLTRLAADPAFVDRVRAITNILDLKTANPGIRIEMDALLNPNLTVADIQAIETMATNFRDVSSLAHISADQRTALQVQLQDRLDHLAARGAGAPLTAPEVARFRQSMADVNFVTDRIRHHDGSTPARQRLHSDQVTASLDLLSLSWNNFDTDMGRRPIPIAFNRVLNPLAAGVGPEGVNLYRDMTRQQAEIRGPGGDLRGFPNEMAYVADIERRLRNPDPTNPMLPGFEYEWYMQHQVQQALSTNQLNGQNVVFVASNHNSAADGAGIDGYLVNLDNNTVTPLDFANSHGALRGKVARQNNSGRWEINNDAMWATTITPAMSNTNQNPTLAQQNNAAMSGLRAFMDGTTLRSAHTFLAGTAGAPAGRIPYDSTNTGLHFAPGSSVATPPSFRIPTGAGGVPLLSFMPVHTDAVANGTPGWNGGRPPGHTTPQEIASAITAYNTEIARLRTINPADPQIRVMQFLVGRMEAGSAHRTYERELAQRLNTTLADASVVRSEVPGVISNNPTLGNEVGTGRRFVSFDAAMSIRAGDGRSASISSVRVFDSGRVVGIGTLSNGNPVEVELGHVSSLGQGTPGVTQITALTEVRHGELVNMRTITINGAVQNLNLNNPVHREQFFRENPTLGLFAVARPDVQPMDANRRSNLPTTLAGRVSGVPPLTPGQIVRIHNAMQLPGSPTRLSIEQAYAVVVAQDMSGGQTNLTQAEATTLLSDARTMAANSGGAITQAQAIEIIQMQRFAFNTPGSPTLDANQLGALAGPARQFMATHPGATQAHLLNHLRAYANQQFDASGSELWFDLAGAL